jgi:hypothetical protein
MQVWKLASTLLLVCGLQLYGQPLGLTAASAAAKVAVGREVSPQAMPALEATGTYILIDVPGSVYTALEGINPQGDIVGGYVDSSNNPHNFLRSNGTFSNFDPPGGKGDFFFLATEMGISPMDIVGSYADLGSFFPLHGFLLSKGAYPKIDAPGASPLSFGTVASGINPLGDIVGFYFDSSGNTHGFLLSKSTYTNIDVPGALGALPGTTVASAINPQGDILGEYSDSSGNTHGFLLSKGTFSAIDIPGATNTSRLE